MLLVDAQALGQEDLEATKPPQRSLPPVVDVAGSEGAEDPDATRLRKESGEPILRASPPSASLPKARPEPSIGTVLGNRYRLERELGIGGMAVVYLAADLQVPGEHFAIKVLKPRLQGHPGLVGALVEELRRTRKLSYPNIVSAYSINSDADGDYMLMEYLEGETLRKLLDQEFGRGIPFARAWPLLIDICAALAYAHDHNVIHSDLKPSNVFVTTRGKVKLLDFGIARVARTPIRNANASTCIAWTQSYASCEMMEGDEPDTRDDIYALGCVVYEMLSGRHPFNTRSAIDARDLKLEPAPLATLSHRQNAALRQALQFDRKQRTDSVEKFLAAMQPQTAPVGPKTAVTAAAVLCIGAVALVGYAVRGRAPALPGPVAARHEATLADARLLATEAARLNVDPDDPRMRAGARALGDAEERVRAGAPGEAQAYLNRAQESLREAIKLGPRITIVGSTPAEVEAAVKLCREEDGDGPDCNAAAFSDETQRRVALRPFVLDKAPVTNADFADFVRETGYVTMAERTNGLYAAAEHAVFMPGFSWLTLRDKDLSPGGEAGEYPVRGINYAAAKAYCDWRGERVPSEDEWEFVARGTQRKTYPWGDRAENGATAQPRRLEPVARLPITGAFETRGLGGEVWEWTSGANDGKPILRGPSYLVTRLFYQRLATRDVENPAHARVDTGFRCAKSLQAWPDGLTGSARASGE